MTCAQCDTVEDFWIGPKEFVPFRFSVLHVSTLLASNRMPVLSLIIIHSLGTNITPLEPWVVLEAWCNAGVLLFALMHLSSFIIMLHCCIGQIMQLDSDKKECHRFLTIYVRLVLGGVTEVSKLQPDAVSENDTTSVRRCHTCSRPRQLESWRLAVQHPEGVC